MAAPGRRKGGHRGADYNRQMDLPWRNPPPRSGSPGSPVINGSPHSARRREVASLSADQDHERNVNFLARAWRTVETDIKSGHDKITMYSVRNNGTPEFQPCDLDSLLRHIHQLRQQQQQQSQQN